MESEEIPNDIYSSIRNSSSGNFVILRPSAWLTLLRRTDRSLPVVGAARQGLGPIFFGPGLKLSQVDQHDGSCSARAWAARVYTMKSSGEWVDTGGTSLLL